MKKIILLLTVISHFAFGQNNSAQYKSSDKTTTQYTGVVPKAKIWSAVDSIGTKQPIFIINTGRLRIPKVAISTDTSIYKHLLARSISGDSIAFIPKSYFGGGGSSTIDTTKVGSIYQGRGTAPIFMYFNGTAWVRNDTIYAPKSSLLGYVKTSGALGTPSSGNLANCTGYEVNNISGLGSGVFSALGINIGISGSFVENGGSLGTPSGGDASNLTNFPSTLATTTLADGTINIGDGTNTAFPRTLSGDITVSNLGVTTIDTTKWTKKTIDLFIVAGQSNAQGSGHNLASGSPTNSASYALQYYNKTLSVCNDPVGNAVNASAWAAFAQQYNKLTGKALCIVPTAVGGTSQTCAADLGSGNWDTCGVLVDSAIVITNRAIVALRAQGWTVNIKGVLWCQGEYDAAGINNSLITQATYIAAFTKMRKRFRNSFGKLPFYIFQTGTRTTQSDAGYESIRQAQVNATNIDSLSKIVFYEATSFAKRGLLVDDVHYTGVGYNQMGRVGAENIVGAFKTVQSMGDRKNLFQNSAYLNYSNLGFNTSKVATTLHINKTITDTVPTSMYNSSTDPMIISSNSFQQMIGYIASSSANDRFIIKGTSAGGTVMSPTLVGTGRYALTIAGSAYDGATTQNTGTFNFITEGTPSLGNVPMAFTIETGTFVRSERFRIKSSGEIGIGTTNPIYSLDLRNSAFSGIRSYNSTASSAGSGSFVTIQGALPSTNGHRLGTLAFGAFDGTTSTTSATIEAFSSQAQTFGSALGTELQFKVTANSSASRATVMTIANDAKVGIGETTPTSKLHIKEGSLGTTAGNSLALLDLQFASSNPFNLTTTAYRISSGSSWLTAAIRTQMGVDGLGINSFGYTQYDADGISFGTNPSISVAPLSTPERMRITGAGNVGIGVSSPNSTLNVNGSFALAYVAKTANYTATASDYLINCTSGTFTVTLPTAVSITGRIYEIVNSGAGTITIATTSSQTFANVTATPTTLSLLTAAGKSIRVMSNGANWIQLN